ncbi:MAG: hypothetical protein KatS3mg059_1537 [Thermomicrobiales bacterium]|nr:MAG: hypothetical protein KatS3mg059_1537 [Thermomicrobiales bacterium]
MSFPHALIQKLRALIPTRARVTEPVAHRRTPHLRIVGGTAYREVEQPARVRPRRDPRTRPGGLHRWRWE